MKKWMWITLICIVGIGILATAGYFIYKWKFASKPSVQQAKVGELNPLNPTFDMIHGKTLKVSAQNGGAISVFDTDKVGMVVTVPPGAVDADVKLKVIPINREKDGLSGLTIQPSDIKFKKPLSLSFDFSESDFKNDNAPDNGMGTGVRTSGSSHVYYYNAVSTSLMPQLVNRSAETKNTIRAEITGGGIYAYILNDKNEVTRAQYALKAKNQTIGVTLESASVLLANKQKIEGDPRDLVSNAITRVKADKSPDIFQLNAALAIEKGLKENKNAFVDKAKADTYSGVLETICKAPESSLEQLISSWKTAQLAGHEAAAENCKIRAQNVIADRVNKILDQPDPTYVDLLKAQQDAELVGLGDKFDPPLDKKRHDKAVREAQELLKDPSVDPRILAIALQNLILFVDDKPDLIAAVEKRMRDGLDTDVQRVLKDPNASKQDIERAIAKNEFNGGNEEIKKQLEDKLKNAQDKAEPKVDETATEQVEEEMPAFDWSIIGAAFLQMMGVEDFSEAGLKAWADEQMKGFEELRTYLAGTCEFIVAMGGSIDCGSYDSQIEDAIQRFGEGMADVAEDVGEVQALPEEEVDNEYDGNNEETISGECISKEEAAEIDPTGRIGYTICPEEEAGTSDDTAVDESSDAGATDVEEPASSEESQATSDDTSSAEEE